MLEKLRIAHYCFVLEAAETMRLPSYKGATLRGAFGHAFKRMTCIRPGSTCDACEHRAGCAYKYVFETAAPPDSDVLRTHESVPRPFIIEPPLDTKTEYRAGEELAFGLVLVGKGLNYFPYFVHAFKELASQGLGQGRGCFRLKQVWATDPLGPWKTLVYDGASDALQNSAIVVTMTDVERTANALPACQLTVEFLTPTELKHNGEIVQKPEFHVLARALLRRTSSLYYFHCDERWETDYRRVVELAETVETVQAEVDWRHWQRHSTRQNQRIDMAGLLGRMSYAGQLAEFRPLLVIGSMVHVGKGCVFGNGKYSVT